MSDALKELDERIRRLDALIEERADGHRGLGLRLALEMATELRSGVSLGTRSGELVASWQAIYPEEWVEEAIRQAGLLLREPSRLAGLLEERLREKGVLPEKPTDA